MPVTFKLRRATRLRWLEVDPILSPGEPAFEIDTGKLKIGDGAKKYSELDYFIQFPPESNDSLPEHVASEDPHPVWDDGPDLTLLYDNAKV